MELRNDGRIGRNRQGSRISASQIINPANMITNVGTLIEGFQSKDDWSVSNVTATNDTAHYREGLQGVKFTASSGGVTSLSHKAINANMSTATTITLVVYIADEMIANLSNGSMRLFLGNEAWGNYFAFYPNGEYKLKAGYNVIRYDISEADIGDGSPSWGSNIVWLCLRFGSGASATEMTFCGLYASQENATKILICADDVNPTIYTEIYDYLKTKGKRFTYFCYGSGVGGGGCITLPQVQEIYAAGNDIGNHTWDHTDLTTLSTEDALANINTMRSWMIAQGFTRGIEHLAYPQGKYTDDIIAGLPGIGIKTARLASGSRWPWLFPPMDYPYLLDCSVIGSYFSLSDVQVLVDKAVARKGSLILLFHQLVESSPEDLEWGISDFHDLIDYIIGLGLEFLTMSEWHNQLSNTRRRKMGMD